MSWFLGAVKRPIAHNFKVGGMSPPIRGLVLHIEEGSENGTWSWFNSTVAQRQKANDAVWVRKGSKGSPATPAERKAALDAGQVQRGRRGGPDLAFPSSAHFGNPKVGQLEQFVDTKNQALAQKAGNAQWISVENEGKHGELLTPSQIDNLGLLLGWLHWEEGVPLQPADTPSGRGLGYHAMGREAWGSHLDCPGRPIINQRALIIERAALFPADSLLRELAPGSTRPPIGGLYGYGWTP